MSRQKACNTDTHYFCPRCETLKPFAEYHRDSTKANGIAGVCKPCKRMVTSACYKKHQYRYPNRLRVKTKPKKGTEAYRRARIRQKTHRKFGSAKAYFCYRCGVPAKQWHHITYEVENVVAVCEPCHQLITNDTPRGTKGL